MHSKKTAFIVEHDFIMAAYLADRSARRRQQLRQLAVH